MLPARISGATRRIAEDQDEYQAISIRDSDYDGKGLLWSAPIREEKYAGANVMWSAWEPSPAELQALILGGTVRLGIMGDVHPPILITAALPPKVTDI